MQKIAPHRQTVAASLTNESKATRMWFDLTKNTWALVKVFIHFHGYLFIALPLFNHALSAISSKTFLVWEIPIHCGWNAWKQRNRRETGHTKQFPLCLCVYPHIGSSEWNHRGRRLQLHWNNCNSSATSEKAKVKNCSQVYISCLLCHSDHNHSIFYSTIIVIKL